MKLTHGLIHHIAVQLLNEENSLYTCHDLDSTSNQSIIQHLTLKCVEACLDRLNIVVRKQFRALTPSPEHIKFIEKQVSNRLPKLYQQFISCMYGDCIVENKDETYGRSYDTRCS